MSEEQTTVTGSKGARRATGDPVGNPRRQRRFSARRKGDAVLRLLHGEGLETLSRELSVAAHELSAWRDRFLTSGQEAMKKRPGDDRDGEIRRLKTKVGDLTMDIELLHERLRRVDEPPFRWEEVEAMSRQTSDSSGKSFGLARVCRVSEVARSGLYAWRRRDQGAASQPRRRPGPQGPCSDAELVADIREILKASRFHGEGYRKVWARLRFKGIRTSRERVRRLMREHGLQAPHRVGRPRGPAAHDGTIITEQPTRCGAPT